MRRMLSSTITVLLIAATSGCGGCDGGGLPEALIEVVPADTQAVFVVDLARLADDLRRFSPYRRFEGRWDALGEALDEVLTTRLGVPLFEADSLAGWAAGEDTWAAVIEGDFEGELPADGPEVAGLRAVRIERDVFAVVAEGRVLVGTQAGLERTLAVIDGEAPSLREADSETATLLREMLDRVGGEIMAMAATAGDLREQFGPMAPDARAFAASSSAAQFTVRARLIDDDAAEATATQLRAMLQIALAGLTERADAMSGDPEEDFAEVAGAVALEHTARLAVDELLTISSQGADVVLALDMQDLGGGIGLVGALGAVAIPAFLKYMRRAQTSETQVELRRLFQSAQLYYVAWGTFPESAPRTPAEVPCGEVGEVRVGAEDPWAHPTWRALEFAPSGSSRYSYQFDMTGQGRSAAFTVSAYGDLDCDGDLSTFTLETWINSDGSLVGGDDIVEWNALE